MHRSPIRIAVALAGVALLVSACSDSKQIAGTGSDTSVIDTLDSGVTTTADPGATTVPSTVAPVTTPAPVTVASTGPTPGPTAPPPAPGSTPLGATTNLHATPGGGITLPAAFACDYDPGIPGWNVADCQSMPSYNDGLIAMVLRQSGDGHFGVAVLFRSGANFVQRYWAEEPGAGTWSGVTLQVGDYHFDDGAEVWVGYRYDGTGQYLDLDVLDPLPGGVFFLGGVQGLDHGVVDLHPGGATVQDAVYAASDPGCCPSNMRQRTITFAADRWRIDAGTTTPAASTPVISGDF
jgi:hypothetical protein